jgi:flavin-dependent dehydrogenase
MNEIKRKIGFNFIERAKFVSPLNHSFEIDRGSQAMIVIDRAKLDQFLATQATEKGCNIHTNHKVKKIERKKGRWFLLIENDERTFTHSTNFLINAEGIHAHLARSNGFPIPNKNWLFPAFQADIEDVSDLEANCSELFFGNRYAPGFFGWVIPLNEESARVGIAVSPWTKGKIRQFFYRFLHKHPALKERFRKRKIIKKFGGIIPASGPISCSYNHDYMVVGDAAGQSKATTGGGVNIGGFCGRLAGKYAAQIVKNELSSHRGCLEYERQWKAYFEPNLSIMKYLRRSISFLTDEAWNDIIKIGKETFISDIMRKSDIDLHGTKLLRYSIQPHVLRRSIHLFPQFGRSFLNGVFQ